MQKSRLVSSTSRGDHWWDGKAEPGDVEAFIAAYDELDALLVSKGFPPTSPWWRDRIERFIRSGRRRSVWRVGRRGGKSSTMCRVIVVLALLYAWRLTPGDPGIIAIVSVDIPEAARRTQMIAMILRSMGIPFRQYASTAGAGCVLLDRPIEIRAKACTIGATSGFTSIVVLADEVSKWHGTTEGSNPAKEIITSLKATMTTIPDSKMFIVSSAYSTTDHHAELIDLGDSEEHNQMVFIGASWEANPTKETSEEATRREMPDRIRWLREFGSIPTEAGDNPWFDPEVIDAATFDDLPERSLPKIGPYGLEGSIACIDTGFRRDASGLVILHWRDYRLHIGLVHEVRRGPSDPPLKPSEVLTEFAALCREHNVKHVGSDQHYIETVREHMCELDLVELPGGNHGKLDVYTAARDTLRDGNARLSSKHVEVRRQLKQVHYKLGSGGNIQIGSPRKDGQHGDIVSAYCGAVWIALNYPLTMRISEDDRITEPESRWHGFD